MPIELKVPSFGESITEVMLGEWLKQPGDKVAQDDPIVVIETDKVTAELPAPADGVVTEVLKQEGASANVGDVVGYMEAGEAPSTGGEAGGEAPSEARESEPEPEPESKPEPEPEPAEQQAEPKQEAGPQPAAEPGEAAESKTGTTADDDRVMPAARRLLHEHGLSASDVEATGPGGRLLKEDVQRHVDGGGGEAAPRREEPQRGRPASGQEATATDVSAIRYPEPPVADTRQEEAVPMSPMRKRIAERLVHSQQTTATLTTFNEIDMTAVQQLRAEYKQSFQEQHGVKLGLMSFFVKAAIEALKAVPGVNAQVRDENIVYHNYYDIGVAVGGGRGLVVPIIRSAERMSFAGIEATIADFAERAKSGKLQLEELQGGTFTISNGGVFGSMLSTPILNPPQSGVLGLHAIQERPVAIEGRVEIRPMMYIALTYDHRIVDGREGVTFLKRVKECMENPARILLEV
jgi:2-oxoglutarate dehydrogenase E2 component (dihydrolipoamide succinyltransferase)